MSEGALSPSARADAVARLEREEVDVLVVGGGITGVGIALDAALRKAIGGSHPALDHLHLTDYKVRVLDTSKGTGAVTRVLIDTTNGERAWSTIGVSENIIEASWQALVDSIVFGLLHAAS